MYFPCFIITSFSLFPFVSHYICKYPKAGIVTWVSLSLSPLLNPHYHVHLSINVSYYSSFFDNLNILLIFVVLPSPNFCCLINVSSGVIYALTCAWFFTGFLLFLFKYIHIILVLLYSFILIYVLIFISFTSLEFLFLSIHVFVYYIQKQCLPFTYMCCW